MNSDPLQELLQDYLVEARERLERVQESLLALEEGDGGARREILTQTKRELHTLKGNSGMMGFRDLQELAHKLEDHVVEVDPARPDLVGILQDLDRFSELLATKDPSQGGDALPAAGRAQGPGVATGVRIPFETLDSLVDQVAQMVVYRNRLADVIRRGRKDPAAEGLWEEVDEARETLEDVLGMVQDSLLKLRMVPLRTLFGSLKRIVHDEAHRLGKLVRLEMEGGETPVDKALLEVAGEALGHLVRNAVVHAIEDPAIRRRRGKLSEGRISLCATVHGGEVRVTVQDDGAGIDPEALLEKARALGMDTAGIESPFSLLFLPSFSTRSAVDLSSGRGMGLSSVQEAVLRLGGSVEVSSEKGEGTRFRLRLPLCVSVMRALLLRADGEEYAVPMLSVVETVQLLPGDGHEINHAGILKWRGGMVPLLDLGRLFGTTGSSRDRGFVVILDVDQRRRGLVGDEISGIQEIVVKELDPLVGKTAGVFGATVLGDGRVILILDPKALISLKPRVGGGAPPREVGP